jgi:hypothetical protein
MASIAVSDGDLFIRTYKHLWCIGAPPPGRAPDAASAGAEKRAR